MTENTFLGSNGIIQWNAVIGFPGVTLIRSICDSSTKNFVRFCSASFFAWFIDNQKSNLSCFKGSDEPRNDSMWWLLIWILSSFVCNVNSFVDICILESALSMVQPRLANLRRNQWHGDRVRCHDEINPIFIGLFNYEGTIFLGVPMWMRER